MAACTLRTAAHGCARQPSAELTLPPVNAFEIPPDTTIRSLIESVVPALHARLVPEDAPTDALAVNVRIEDAGSWTVHIRGREMRVVEGEADRPTLWLFTTARAVELFLEDAAGPRRLSPEVRARQRGARPSSATRASCGAPRWPHGRIELALRDVDGERLAIVFGFGTAARKRIDPDDADVVVEAGLGTLERMLAGTLAPEEALADGDVAVRGNRMLALQLALAVAPFYPQKAMTAAATRCTVALALVAGPCSRRVPRTRVARRLPRHDASTTSTWRSARRPAPRASPRRRPRPCARSSAASSGREPAFRAVQDRVRAR